MKSKKVILYIPPSPWLISDTVELPLGILYLASWIRKEGHIVEIVDMSNNGEFKIYDADFYGIGFTTPQIKYAVDILRNIKKNRPESEVLAGGPHATAMPNQMIELGFDAVIRGEGEIAISDILKNGITRKIYEFSTIKDINTLPFPAWDLIEMETYVSNIGVVSYMNNGNREINVMATRGCTGKCSYCTKYKGSLRWRNIDNIIEEIIMLKDKYKVNRIFFVDDNIVIKKKFLYELCSEMRKLNIPWHCLGRADQVDTDSCLEMKRSGCMGIDFGIESGSQRILDIINKGTTVEKQAQGIISASKAGLKIRAQFMVGLPGEMDEDHEKNIQFIEENNKYVSKWGIHTFVPFPTCDIWENPEKYNYKINTELDFSNYQTIGKPNEWNFKAAENNEILENRRQEILSIISNKNIFNKEKYE